MRKVEQIERWMQTLVMHPQGVETGLQSDSAQALFPLEKASLEGVVLPSRDLSALERISIYANMYYPRLLEVMEDDFPAVRHIFGPDLFEKTAKDYLIRHPSTYPNLNALGQQFPQYLAEEAQDMPHREFVSAVAIGERAIQDVFNERHVERIPIEKLQEIPTDSWHRMQLQLTPALRLLVLDYPVNDYISAVREDRHWDIPDPKATHVAVYRIDYRVWRTDLSLAQFELLSGLNQALTLSEAVEAAATVPGVDTDILIDTVGKWFERWASQGFFCGIETA
ncbi:MAG: DNA-binding domain-containing protein [Proteobacteria bacterium]|nr:DNA-binding domain-containing protein [Pseudomonadota bacterium]